MHNHQEKFILELKSRDLSFDFHPKLSSWLKEKFPESEILRLVEIKCEDNSCPIVETIIELENNKSFRIGKAKDKITKIDFQLAYQNQFLK